MQGNFNGFGTNNPQQQNLFNPNQQSGLQGAGMQHPGGFPAAGNSTFSPFGQGANITQQAAPQPFPMQPAGQASGVNLGNSMKNAFLAAYNAPTGSTPAAPMNMGQQSMQAAAPPTNLFAQAPVNLFGGHTQAAAPTPFNANSTANAASSFAPSMSQPTQAVRSEGTNLFTGTPFNTNNTSTMAAAAPAQNLFNSTNMAPMNASVPAVGTPLAPNTNSGVMGAASTAAANFHNDNLDDSEDQVENQSSLVSSIKDNSVNLYNLNLKEIVEYQVNLFDMRKREFKKDAQAVFEHDLELIKAKNNCVDIQKQLAEENLRLDELAEAIDYLEKKLEDMPVGEETEISRCCDEFEKICDKYYKSINGLKDDQSEIMKMINENYERMEKCDKLLDSMEFLKISK
ncbi:hypothetical protein ENBRE01_0972 [Enteropsectra breve]|nr:hypothetical protein ENBRE01_0972 [Enteropsectra breve]